MWLSHVLLFAVPSVSMWPRSRCGLGLDMTSVSLWPRFQYVLGLDVASVLMWPRSRCSLVLDVTSISMWPRSRCDLVVNMASVLMWPRSRSGLGLDVASASILPRSRCGPCFFPCPEAVPVKAVKWKNLNRAVWRRDAMAAYRGDAHSVRSAIQLTQWSVMGHSA